MSVDELVDYQQLEVLRGLQSFVGENLRLWPIDEAWQPTDYLPDMNAEDWVEQVEKFRGPARQLDDQTLVVLVADMITEEALPSYSISLNLLAGDATGCSPEPWAKWMRGWSAEENRHGDLLNAYLRLTGRVDMRAVEITIHNLLNNGFDPKAYPDPYGGLIYTAFQERATKISHANVARKALAQGDVNLNTICLKIAGDEARHERFYTRVMGQVMEQDPDGGIMTFRNMMRRVIQMPGRLMFDGKDPELFDHFAAVAQREQIYTIYDYASITDHLIKTWKVADRVVTGKAARAQEYLCKLPDHYRLLAERVGEDLEGQPRFPFSWIHGRIA